MAGSIGMQFARVAARHKLVSRRQLASWGFEHLRYRLRGTTDERTHEVLRARPRTDRRRSRAQLRTDEPGGDGGDPAARLPADAGRGLRPPGRGPTHLHRQRRRQRRGRAAARTCSAWTAALAPATKSVRTAPSPAASTGRSSTARARSRRCRSLPPSTASTSPPPTPTRTRSPTCRCCARSATRWSSIRTPAARDRPRGGLADAALRAPRPSPRRARRHPARHRRRLRRLAHRRPPQGAPAPPLPRAPLVGIGETPARVQRRRTRRGAASSGARIALLFGLPASLPRLVRRSLAAHAGLANPH